MTRMSAAILAAICGCTLLTVGAGRAIVMGVGAGKRARSIIVEVGDPYRRIDPNIGPGMGRYSDCHRERGPEYDLHLHPHSPSIRTNHLGELCVPTVRGNFPQPRDVAD